MLNIPIYREYKGEKKIALLDNTAIEFMMRLEQEGCNPDYLLQWYDVIFLPCWVLEEVMDSAYRTEYIKSLCQRGIPLYQIREESYSDLMDNEELHLYYIVKASVSRLAALLKYIRIYVEQKDPLDMDAYENWIRGMYSNWPMINGVTANGRMKRKNAGEISLTILAEIFSWHYSDTEMLTVYTQDSDAYVFQKTAEEKLRKVFEGQEPVSVTYCSNDMVLCQLYRDGKIGSELIDRLRTNPRVVTYMVMREDRTFALEVKALENNDFLQLIQKESAQIIF